MAVFGCALEVSPPRCTHIWQFGQAHVPRLSANGPIDLMAVNYVIKYTHSNPPSDSPGDFARPTTDGHRQRKVEEKIQVYTRTEHTHSGVANPSPSRSTVFVRLMVMDRMRYGSDG